MYCRFCYQDGWKVEAVAIAAQDFAERQAGDPVYEYMPVCWDHLSTWNNGATEQFPVFQIRVVESEDFRMEHSLTYAPRDEHS